MLTGVISTGSVVLDLPPRPTTKVVQEVFFAILDVMVLNAFFAWNMSGEEVEVGFKEARSNFYAALSEEFMQL